jgi:hypothetical protein
MKSVEFNNSYQEFYNSSNYALLQKTIEELKVRRVQQSLSVRSVKDVDLVLLTNGAIEGLDELLLTIKTKAKEEIKQENKKEK